MDALHRLAEERIQRAREEGRLETGALRGRPIPPDRLEGVPDDLRLGWKVLGNAGYLPEEIELERERLRLEDLLACCTDDAERLRMLRDLRRQELRIALLRERRGGLTVPARYAASVARRLAGGEESPDPPGFAR